MSKFLPYSPTEFVDLARMWLDENVGLETSEWGDREIVALAKTLADTANRAFRLAANSEGTGDTPRMETEAVLARTDESAEIIGPPEPERVNHLADDPGWRATGSQCENCFDLFRESPTPKHQCRAEGPTVLAYKKPRWIENTTATEEELAAAQKYLDAAMGDLPWRWAEGVTVLLAEYRAEVVKGITSWLRSLSTPETPRALADEIEETSCPTK